MGAPRVQSSPTRSGRRRETAAFGPGLFFDKLRGLTLGAAVCIAAFILAMTADERPFGLVTDGQIMTRTAYAIAETGELGMAQGHPVNLVRPAGDAVTRYGLGFSLFQVPIVLLAGPFERAFGLGSSQTLFVLGQLFWVLVAALAAAGLVRAWGGDARSASLAVLATSVASPLWGYVCSDFSEPLQAATVAGSLALASLATSEGVSPRRETLLSAAAGAAAGLGLLTKSILVVLLPCVAFVLIFSGRRDARLRRLAAAAAGAAPLVATWLAFELVRFGRPFASYRGESFSNPVLDGLWRLTVGPNKGLLLYFPLALLAVAGAFRLVRERGLVAAAPLGLIGFLTVTTAAWWSWDGTAGWGPRLLVPAIPLLAALAVLGARFVPRPVFPCLFALGVGVNLLGALQPDSVTSWYYSILPRVPLTESEAARYPAFAVKRDSKGVPELLQVHAVHRNAAFSPIRLSAWLLEVRLSSVDPLRALSSPPWDTTREGQQVDSPPERAIPDSARMFLTSRFRWPHLGMSLRRGAARNDTALAYVDCVYDQALRAQDLHDGERAFALGARLYEMVPGPQSAVAYLEGLRLSGRYELVGSFVGGLPSHVTSTPEFGLAWALLARDRGEPERARKIVEKVLRVAPRPEIRSLAGVPPERWPSTVREILRSGA